MNTTAIDSKAAALLSRILGKSLTEQEITPSLVFLSTLVALLTGTMMADNSASEVEKQLWQKTIKRFISEDKNIQEVVKLLFQGIREQKVHQNFELLKILVASLSPSEKLLLLGFGYEMSAADECISTEEIGYLDQAATCLDISKNHQEILKSAITGKSISKTSELEEVINLLDPVRFYELDNILVSAAEDLCKLITTHIQETSSSTIVQAAKIKTSFGDSSSGDKLGRFQHQSDLLMNESRRFMNFLQGSVEQDWFPRSWTQELEEKLENFAASRFRVAVAGEFSRGKSMLLNALLKASIQPVSSMPCSSVITVLRFGDKKRIICRFKDGREEEISSIEEYKKKASLPENQENGIDENSDYNLIEEIIVEDPELELCKNGIEIVDSPGFNESVKRENITNKLLENVDALILLTSAMQILPITEQELFACIRRKINGQNNSTPEIDNLFLLVNFMDVIDKEDRPRIQKYVESFILKSELTSKIESRVHYISARRAFDAFESGQKDEWTDKFENFVGALKDFLVNEKGASKFKRFSEFLLFKCNESLDKLIEIEDSLNQGLQTALEERELEKRNRLEEMASIAAHETRIRQKAESILFKIDEEGQFSFSGFSQRIEESLKNKSEKWVSSNSVLWGQKGLVEDYTRQFTRDLVDELNEWIEHTFIPKVLKPNLESLNTYIQSELESIRRKLSQSNLQSSKNLSQRIQSAMTSRGINSGYSDLVSYLGTSGVMAAILAFIQPVSLIMELFSPGQRVRDWNQGTGWIDKQIKDKLIAVGLKDFLESTDDLYEHFEAEVVRAINQYVDLSSKLINEAVEQCENSILQIEKMQSESSTQLQERRALIASNREKIEEIRQSIRAI